MKGSGGQLPSGNQLLEAHFLRQRSLSRSSGSPKVGVDSQKPEAITVPTNKQKEFGKDLPKDGSQPDAIYQRRPKVISSPPPFSSGASSPSAREKSESWLYIESSSSANNRSEQFTNFRVIRRGKSAVMASAGSF